MWSELENILESEGVSSSGKKKILEEFNRGLLKIGETILELSKDTKKELKKDSEKKFASKKAEEYAKENGLSLEDFDILKVGKSDVDKEIRDRVKNKVVKDSNIISKERKNGEKIICCGITKKGEPCNRVGTYQPEGAKNKYCFRHQEDFKAFETEEDSSVDLQEEEEVPNLEEIKEDSNSSSS